MKKLGFGIAVLLSLGFISCASVKKEGGKNLNPVYVTNSKKIEILTPDLVETPNNTYQLVEGSFGDNSFSMLAYMEIIPEGIFVSLLNDFGTDMGSLSYDGNNVFFESPYFPKKLKGEYIISDIQNVYYSVESLKENYKNSGLSFICDTIDGVEVRKILSGEKVIEEIRKENETVTLKNYLRGYEFKLTDGGIVE